MAEENQTNQEKVKVILMTEKQLQKKEIKLEAGKKYKIIVIQKDFKFSF